MAPHLQITSVPAGEAPVWIREKWVGLMLPLARKDTNVHNLLIAGGVLSGPRTFLGRLMWLLRGKCERNMGYAVEVITAVKILEAHSPEAAKWWRENTPHLIKPGQCFVFQEREGHVADGAGA